MFVFLSKFSFTSSIVSYFLLKRLSIFEIYKAKYHYIWRYNHMRKTFFLSHLNFLQKIFWKDDEKMIKEVQMLCFSIHYYICYYSERIDNIILMALKKWKNKNGKIINLFSRMVQILIFFKWNKKIVKKLWIFRF